MGLMADHTYFNQGLINYNFCKLFVTCKLTNLVGSSMVEYNYVCVLVEDDCRLYTVSIQFRSAKIHADHARVRIVHH